MKNKESLLRLLFIAGIIAVFAILRIFIQIPNVSPIAALALFGGTFIKRKDLALVLPLCILAISDLFIGSYEIGLMLMVYASFLMIGVIGLFLRKSTKFANVIGASLLSSVIFFLVSNFGVWMQGWYSLTWAGLIECYTMAIPFFRHEIIGTLAFTLFFFGSYELASKYLPFLKVRNA